VNSVYIILGGNRGNRRKNLLLAHHMIGMEIGKIHRFSNIYETEPWGFKDSKTFLNQVVEIHTSLKPLQVLEKARIIEAVFGHRLDNHVKYQPRRMDLDILFYNREIIHLPELIIPHPLLHERNFVLTPLCELAANFIHPVFNKTILQLKTDCKDNKWTRIVTE
jgi:2-amino-4-hydroxy-6-hydroxymethyldihydropteridine diphosphokinase